MEMSMKIVLGTTSKIKIQAVQEACGRVGFKGVEVVGVKVASAVNEQPYGFEETMKGALHRATQAQLDGPEDGDLYIGIESGVVGPYGGDVILDLAVIAIVYHGNKTCFATSTGITFPGDAFSDAFGLGFKTTTVGSIIAKNLGGDGADPHSTLTQGKLTRNQTLVDGVAAALAQVRF
jgi:inosine/xanthosine triphosphatase